MKLRADRLAALTAPENEEQTMLALVERIGKGTHTFNGICEELDVPYTRFLVWLQGDEKRWGLFLKAHEARSVNFVDEAIAIADDSRNDTQVDESGCVVVNNDVIARSKLRVDTRFRYAQHYAPGLFGKRVQHEHSAVGDLGERLRRARERVIPAEVADVPAE